MTHCALATRASARKHRKNTCRDPTPDAARLKDCTTHMLIWQRPWRRPCSTLPATLSFRHPDYHRFVSNGSKEGHRQHPGLRACAQTFAAPKSTKHLLGPSPPQARTKTRADSKALQRRATPSAQKGGTLPSQTRGARQSSVLGGRTLTKREKERADRDSPQRLAKVVAQAGIASRRAAEDLVTSGLVKVNGKVVMVPQHMVLASVDTISVRGRPLPRSVQRYYFALNKPKGYLCANRTAQDSGQERLVVDLFQPWIKGEWKLSHPHPNAVPPRLFTVGRLDVQTTGLILVTNDGDWAQKVQHPSNNLTKEYVVTLARTPTAHQLEDIAAGCVIDGAFVKPKSISYATADRRDKLRVVIGEGRNREVRALMENAALEVSSLKRVRIGGFRLPKDLSIGEFQELKSHHVKRVIDRGAQDNPHANSVLR